MSWSLSALKTYEKCPAQYKFKYIENIQTKHRSPAAERGTEMHKYIEDYLNGSTKELPQEINFYTQFLDRIKETSYRPELTIILDRGWNPVGKDSPDRWYKGVLDLLILGSPEANHATVVDWKTGKIYPEHDDQKAIYSLAVFATYPDVLRVRALHVYLDLGQNREITYDRDQMYNMRTVWEARVKRLEEETQFIPNPTYMCRFCPFAKDNGGPCRF